MDLIFVVPVLTVLLLAIYRFVEYKFITHTFKPAKHYIQEIFLIFLLSLISNAIFTNISPNLTDFFNTITNKHEIVTNLPLEIFTENPSF